MKTLSLIGALGLTAISTLAIAQATAPTAAPSAAPAATAAPGMDGMKMATSATMAVKFMTVKPADVMSSKLVGIDIYNNQNEKLGEIDDLVIENGKTVSGLVVGVGGFIGLGESYVVLDPSTVVLNQKDNSWRAYVDTNKETLKNAPKFEYSKKKS